MVNEFFEVFVYCEACYGEVGHEECGVDYDCLADKLADSLHNLMIDLEEHRGAYVKEAAKKLKQLLEELSPFLS